MHVDIDWDRCEGHGLCTQRAPQVFDLDDDGNLLYAFDGRDVPPELAEDAAAAAAACPVAALRAVE